MIHIERGSIPIPEVLNPDQPTSLGSRELERAKDWFLKGKRERHSRFHFKAYMHPSVKGALRELFHGKCAYCESTVDATQSGEIDLYRSKGIVQERQDHQGYWWLAMDWNNLLLSCANCNRSKHSRFPLSDEKMRAYKPGEELHEKPLILDPTRDNPDEHLIHDPETGEILGETERGQATIDIVGLNRPALCQARFNVAQNVTMQIHRFRTLIEKFDDKHLIGSEVEALVRLTKPDQEYSHLKRQMILPLLAEFDSEQRAWISSSFEKFAYITKARKKAARKRQADYQLKHTMYSLENEEGRQIYRESVHVIEAIRIINLRAIQRIDIDLTASELGYTQWLMLLGENSTGKSTILQAVALTLIGADYFMKLARNNKLNPSDYIRRRCSKGLVEVKLSGFSKPHRLEFRKDSVTFNGPNAESCRIVFEGGKARQEGVGWDPQTVLLSYGATRLLPQTEVNKISGGEFARVDNLFDPFQPLFDAKAWMLGLKRSEFDMAALIMKDLLSLHDDAFLTRRGGNIYVNEQGGQKVPLEQLSDGYQTAVALVVDILEVAQRVWGNYESARGIVLIDEIGTHLHPTWQMRIVESMRNALPGVQFITTTHQPLCLRGLGEHEVVVMRRSNEKSTTVEAITDLPSPAEFRVDQLLTSEYFGLNSTVDPDTERDFDRYYALLAMRNPTQVQQNELDKLKEKLRDKRHLGSTLREELMYEAIDRLLVNQRTSKRKPLIELKQEAIDQISMIWNQPMSLEPGDTKT